MLTFKNDDLSAKLRASTGTSVVVPTSFQAFTDPEEDLRQQMEKARVHPWLPKEIPIRGFVYDVRSGRLKEVK
jgi:carbonic anhydrase